MNNTKKLSTRSFTFILVTGVGLFGLTLLAVNQGWFQRGSNNSAERDQVNSKEKPKEIPAGWTVEGGVPRPISDTRRLRDARPKQTPKGYHPGGSPAVKKDANANAKSIYAARQNKKLQYRFTSMQPAPKFDRKEYQSNPQKYLDEVVPGRMNQSLPPSRDVVPIKRVGKYIYDNVLQGESVKLRVQVEKNMPVTFQSNRLGQFENQLSTMTVAANDDGIAEVDFKLSGGTRDSIDVRATSPVHSHDARWLINVVPPNPEKTNK